MKIEEITHKILFGETLEDKLFQGPSLTDIKFSSYSGNEIPYSPGRQERLKFSEVDTKFPKVKSFHQNEKRGEALHFFANHELLAIEMMSATILLLPHQDLETFKIKKAILSTLIDEQKHLKLYIERMNQLGIEFGDFPLNDFFWRQMGKIKNFASYYALMALTFESANLDFANYYKNVFLHFEDQKTAEIMQTVFDDEVSHVAVGFRYLERTKASKDTWTYYMESLPFPLTPARAKGINYQEDFRMMAGINRQFIDKLSQFRDVFQVTNRREKKEIE